MAARAPLPVTIPRAVATWVVGDVQGCFSTWLRLAARIGYRRGRDRIWFVGDLVNRGPDSLGMLRWVVEQGDSANSVLGNHDLHLLAQREGILGTRRRDTLAPVLGAADSRRLCEWVARRPFTARVGPFLLVHAGLHPAWAVPEAERRAAAAAEALRGDRRGFLEALYAARGDGRPRPRSGRRARRLADPARDASVLTRIRAVNREGAPRFGFNGSPDTMPPRRRPWFEKARIPAGLTVLFGHWAALGLISARAGDGRVIGLDSGCVWGGFLTAVRLEDGAFAIEPTAPGDGRWPT